MLRFNRNVGSMKCSQRSQTLNFRLRCLCLFSTKPATFLTQDRPWPAGAFAAHQRRLRRQSSNGQALTSRLFPGPGNVRLRHRCDSRSAFHLNELVQPVLGRMQPRTALHVAQHKLVHLRRTV